MKKWLELRNVSIAYGERNVVSDCSFTVPKGQILSLLGPSGCGKSTILKAIAGLLPVAAGSIYLNGQLMSSDSVNVAPQLRHVGMIFQDYALFPHMTVAENVAFGLHGMAKEGRKEKVLNMLDMVQLADFAARYPHALSGGQQQRVAIARAMAREPDLMLLDEPFSNLDNAVREALMDDMRRLFRAREMSAIFVTHNKVEAFALSDTVAVMRQGEIGQMDSPTALYDHPANDDIAAFLGSGATLRFNREAGYWANSAGRIAFTARHDVMVRAEDDNGADIFLRPHQLLLSADDNGNGVIESARFLGDFSLYRVRLQEQSADVVCKNRLIVGQRVRLALRVA